MTSKKRALKSSKSAAAERPVKHRDRQATTRLLLEAATSVFARRGYDAATTKEIARGAKVNETLIQRYFGSKAGLLEAILEQAISVRRTMEMDAEAPKDLKHILESFFSGVCVESGHDKEFQKLVASRAILDPRIAALMRKKVFEARKTLIRRRLEGLQAEGLVRRNINLDPLSHAITSLRFALGFFDTVVLGFPEKKIQRVVDEVIDQMMHGLKP